MDNLSEKRTTYYQIY